MIQVEAQSSRDRKRRVWDRWRMETRAPRVSFEVTTMGRHINLLVEAIGRRSPAVVRIRRREGSESFDICFVADARPAGDDGIWAELVGGEPNRIDRLAALQAAIEVVFLNGPTRLSFESVVMRRQKLFLRGHRVLISWPTHVDAVERRNGARERIPARANLTARFQIDAATSQAIGEIQARVYDLSSRGAALLYPPGARVPALEPGQELEVAFTLDGAEHRLPAQHRNTRILPDGAVRLGVQFSEEPPATGQIPAPLQKLLEDLQAQRARESLGVITGRGAA